MKFQQLVFLMTFLFSAASYGQIIENTFADGDNVIIAKKHKKKINFNFSNANGTQAYCFMPFTYKSGSISLPKDKNGNSLHVTCKYITASDKKLSVDLKDHFNSRKFDGMFLFNSKQTNKFMTCFRDTEEMDRIADTNDSESPVTIEYIRNRCLGQLNDIHVVALKKKKKLNKSTQELLISHMDNSSRSSKSKSNGSSSIYSDNESNGSFVIAN
jgi:hypothetical protein